MHEPKETRPVAILAVAVLGVVSLGAAADPNATPVECTGAECALPGAPDAPQDTVLELLETARAALDKAVAELRTEAEMQVEAAKAAATGQVEQASKAAAAKLAEAQTAVAGAQAEVDAAKAQVEAACAATPHCAAAVAAATAAKADAEAAARAKAREALLAPPERIWTSLNDGAGSGLDADYLDSLSSGDFIKMVKDEAAARVAGDDAVRASIPDAAWSTVLARDGPGSGLDADTLDGVDAGQFVSKDAGGSVAVPGSLKVGGGSTTFGVSKVVPGSGRHDVGGFTCYGSCAGIISVAASSGWGGHHSEAVYLLLGGNQNWEGSPRLVLLGSTAQWGLSLELSGGRIWVHLSTPATMQVSVAFTGALAGQ